MSTFEVQATLMNPDQRDRFLVVDLLVDTGATYTLLPIGIVAELGLTTPYELPVVLASGEQIPYRVGEVRVKLGDREHSTVALVGPLGARPLLGAVTLEGFGLVADPVHRRLIPAPPLAQRPI
jgi:clan AA aspartic protease